MGLEACHEDKWGGGGGDRVSGTFWHGVLRMVVSRCFLCYMKSGLILCFSFRVSWFCLCHLLCRALWFLLHHSYMHHYHDL